MEVSIRDTYWIQDPSRLKSYHPCHQEKSIYFKHHIVWDTINGWQMRLTNPFCWALLTTGFGTRIDNTINSTNSDAMRNAQDISISNQMTFNSDDEAAWVASNHLWCLIWGESWWEATWGASADASKRKGCWYGVAMMWKVGALELAEVVMQQLLQSW